MAEGSDFPKPTFTIEDDGEFAELRLRSLENDIYKRPRVYEAVLGRLGAVLTADTIAHDDRRTHSEAVSNNPAHRLHEFFTLRFDRLIEFDDASEQAISQDETYNELLAGHRASKNKAVKLGIQKTGTQPDPNAEPMRDQLRRKRLELFIGRIADWNATQSHAKTVSRAPKQKLQKGA